jgi:alanine dehydrogenase
MEKKKYVVGVPKEVKPSEGRVGLTPEAAAEALKTERCEKVLVQDDAGVLSGYDEHAYLAVKALILKLGAHELYKRSDLIVKVKEIMPQEYHLLHEGQAVFTYLHPAANPEMIKVFLEKKILGISYDTIATDDGKLPVLKPMSEVAGMLAIDKGIASRRKDAEAVQNVTIIGGGVAGYAALERARQIGLNVKILDTNEERLRAIKAAFPEQEVRAIKSTPLTLISQLRGTQLLVGAVLVPGGTAPKVITREMLKLLEPGTVIVDISIDQGGCIATSHPTTHDNPTFEVDGIIHYCVANMPGCVPELATKKLVAAHLPYLIEMLTNGLEPAEIMTWSNALKRGVVTRNGHLTHEQVARDLKVEYVPLEKALS